MCVDLGHCLETRELLLADLGHSLSLDLYIVKQCYCPSVHPDVVKEVHCLSMYLYFLEESYPSSLVPYIVKKGHSPSAVDVVNVGNFPSVYLVK